MKLYADYEFYIEKYQGTEELKDFDRSIIHASQYIRNITLGRSDNYNGEELKYASCALVDAYLSAYRLSGDNAQIKSENNDGYSVSYVTQTVDGESSEELFERKAYPIARQWLLKTGLLSRRVGYIHSPDF